MYDSFCKWKLAGKGDSFFNKKLKNHKYLIENLSSKKLPELEREQDAYKAVSYIKEYYPHREWMKLNKIDFADFKEEIQFQKYNKQFNITANALQV